MACYQSTTKHAMAVAAARRDYVLAAKDEAVGVMVLRSRSSVAAAKILVSTHAATDTGWRSYTDRALRIRY